MIPKMDSEVKDLIPPKKAKADLLEGTSVVLAKKLCKEELRTCSALEKVRKSSGARAQSIADRLLSQTASATLPLWRPKDTTPGERLELAANTLAEMEPSNLTEAMLATQTIAASDAALMFLYRATLENQYSQAIDANLFRAARLMRVFGEQLEAMQKLKGKAAQQKVVVEHVHIHGGAQAIVGAVSARGPGEGVGGDTKNR